MTRRLRALLGLGIGLLTTLALPAQRKQIVHPQYPRLSQRVNTLIGTDWVGNVYPGASAPFGMVQLSPDNGRAGWDYIAGYFYPDSTIAGFSHTHLSGTGAGDLYDISFLPVTLPALDDRLTHKPQAGKTGEEQAPIGIHARFSHATEVAKAGYYAVTLEPYDIRVELTATDRVGVQRYTFQKDADSVCIILNLDKAMNWDRTVNSDARAISPTQITGFRYSDGWARNQKVYFTTKLSRPAARIERTATPYILSKGQVGKSVGHGVILRLYYNKVRAGESITLCTALSGVSEAGALKNLQAEAPHTDFNRYRQAATHRWDKHLAQIRLSADTPDSLQTTFYTALYRAQICPTLYSDVDGRYLGADREIHQRAGGTYSTFSLWDTYRAAHPLYSILQPNLQRDFVQSLIDFGEQNEGHLPVWNMFASETDMMIGYHSVPVIVEAVLRGIYVPKDKAKLLHLLRTTAERKGYRGLDDYRKKGYVASDREDESVSKTLEYAYDDDAIARYAAWMGDREVEKIYRERARSYRHLWDEKTGFFRPRKSNGELDSVFDPFAYTKPFTESNAYHYLFSVQHDIDGLTKLMQGKLGERLDEFFSSETPSHIELPIFSTGMIGQYAHGNEPGHHVIFLYNAARQPWKTTDLTHRVLKQLYTDKPAGLCGNEDCGQMSAWYVFASLGFYPVDPLSGRYELVTPLFRESTISLPNGRTLRLSAPKLSEKKRYIKRVTINGRELRKSYITYDDVMQGGEIRFTLTDQPGSVWYE